MRELAQLLVQHWHKNTIFKFIKSKINTAINLFTEFRTGKTQLSHTLCGEPSQTNYWKVIMLFHLLSVPFTCHGVIKCYFQLQHSCLEQMGIREEKWFSLIQRCFYHLLINLIIYVVKLNTNSLGHFTLCHCSQSRNAAKLRAVLSQTDGALQGWTVLSWVALPVWQNWHIASADRLIRLASSDKW